MKKSFLGVMALTALSGGALLAQDLTGTWQGTLTLPNGKDLRTVIKVTKEGNALRGQMFSIDQGAGAIPINPVTLQGTAVKMSMPGIGGSYEGKLEADGNTITGNRQYGLCLFDLSFANFDAGNNITGNNQRGGALDVACFTQYTATRGALTNIGGGTTNLRRTMREI